MNEKQFEEAIKTTLKELCSMSREEFHLEMKKHQHSDFARIFSEANDDYPTQVYQLFKAYPKNKLSVSHLA
ncbi:MAG: hypothetical protein DRR16_20360 [Candidatus Parabeggiatoa sp. nov. 3]|nr:MAG: hypothetical protein DRR00_05945 [Gammaproteobacteria bacterium]RKZ63059.1 MAG: hypothetical protein DRQ99_17725 [Gammaproteobacteria bacterium]RKZ82148.1 MAG: hypothetical protein DRR16_20360 [Gammaproteobacteria bacterium]